MYIINAKLDAPAHRLQGEYDVKRLSSYARNLVDHHLVLDLVPLLARLRFDGLLLTPISSVQAAILVAVGLQGRDFDALHKDLNLPVSQVQTQDFLAGVYIDI